MAAGGLFLETRYSGRFFDQDFEGVGLIGYDNAAGRYNGLWVDSMGSYLVAFKDSFNSYPIDSVASAVASMCKKKKFNLWLFDAYL